MTARQSLHRQHGFTLIELLMAIAISGIVLGAIGTAFISALRGTASAHDRFVASNGAHSLSTYFTADVQSANPDFVDTAPGALLGCASEPSGTTNVVRVQWSEMSTSSELRAFSVSYRIKALDTDGDSVNDHWQLVRYSCSASEDPFTTTMATVLSGGTLADTVVVDDLHEPTGSYVTAASVDAATREISMLTFAALAKDESSPYSYTFSGTMRTPEPAPRVTSILRNGPATTNAATVAWTVTLSEAVTGVDSADFAFTSTGGLSGASVASVAGSGTTYTVTANSGTGQGTLALRVDDNDSILSALDGDPLGGTGVDNGDYTGPAYTVDRLAPTVVVAQGPAQADPTSSLPIQFTATFDENVFDFGNAGDVVNTGTAPGATFSVTGSGKDYVISATVAGSGTVSPSVVAGAARDAAGNGNTVSTNGPDNQVTYTVVSPTVVITNVQMANAGSGSSQVGRVDKGDQVVVTFSHPMDGSTFCSSWSGPNPSITGNGVVRVTVTNGAGGANDVLTVTTTSGCTFNLGSINLGSGAWVNATTTFEGNGGNASALAYNDAARQLTITLGNGTSGPSGVGASQPTYTSHPAIRSATGQAITNSPFTAPAASQF